MVSTLGITDFVCYSDSLHSVSLINKPPDFLAKMGAPSDSVITNHTSPPEGHVTLGIMLGQPTFL